MNKFMILKILSRIVIYGCLAAFFFAFYLQDQMSDFLLRRTTVTSRIEQVSELDPPTLTICMDPPFKISLAKKFNFSNQFNIFFEDYNFSNYQERFEKLSYVLNQDFLVNITIYGDNYPKFVTQLSQGTVFENHTKCLILISQFWHFHQFLSN